MIIAEILTDAGAYNVNLPTVATLAEAAKLIDDGLKEGKAFEGPNGLFIIGQGASIKHIFIREEQDDVIPFMEEVDDVEPPKAPEGPYIFTTDRCTFLGTKVQVVGQAIEKNGHTWYLPMEVNGQPALDVLSPASLEDFIIYWKASIREYENSITVVVPPAQLPDYEEALEYLQDYIKETTPPTEILLDKNAKAWQGWRGNDK